jgi:colanic acid/amylovoran biosynthesis protein
VLIDDLRRVFPRVDITILRLEPVSSNSFFEGIPERPGFMCHALNRYDNLVIKLAYTIYMICATLAGAAWFRGTGFTLPLPRHLQEIADLYTKADLIVPVGGGYLRSRKGLLNRLNVPLLLHPLFFGYLLGKPTVLYSQSMGPFQNKLEERMVAFVLRRMTLILLRENTSMALLAKMGVTDNVSRAVDSGFLLRSGDAIDLRKRYHISGGKVLVGVTVRSWLKGSAQDEYETAVASALDTIIESSNVHALFIPQVTAAKGDDDRLASRRVQDAMRHKASSTLVVATMDHHQIKAMYDGLDVLLGTRFHSVIFSLTSYVPVLAVEYEHKTSGIMRDLGLEGWVVKIEDISAQNLTQQLQRLLRERVSYGQYLHMRVPSYIQRSKRTVDLLEKALSVASREQNASI